MAELNVQLRADITKFIRALDKAEKALLDVDNAAENTAESTEKVGKSAKKLDQNTANATPTLLEFNRVIQDAPFGIQGVANNITQLTQNFGTLRTSIGGTVPALKLLLGSLAGPAGILFAVSAITSLLVQFGGSAKKAASEVEKLEKKVEDLNKVFDAEIGANESIQKLLEAQGRSTDAIRKDTAEKVQTQIQSVQAILLENQALQETLRLQRESVTLWQGLAGFLRTGFQNIIDDITRDLSTAAAIAGVLAEETAARTGLTEKLAQFVKENKELTEDESQALIQNRQLVQQLNDLRLQALELEKETTKEIQNQAEAIKAVTRERQAQAQNIIPTQGIAVGDPTIGTEDALTTSFNNITVAQAQFLADLEAFNQEANKIISQGFAQTIANIGQGIGTAIATGGNVLQAIGGTLLQSLGQLLQQVGRAAIQIGVGMLAIKFAFKNPFGAIAAGTALVALGSAISSSVQGSLNQIGGGQTGGFGGGGTGGSTFTGGTSPVGGSFDGGRVVFEISGTSLIGVLSRTANRNQRIGGGFSIG